MVGLFSVIVLVGLVLPSSQYRNAFCPVVSVLGNAMVYVPPGKTSVYGVLWSCPFKVNPAYPSSGVGEIKMLSVYVPTGTVLNDPNNVFTLTLCEPSTVAFTKNSTVVLSPAPNCTTLFSMNNLSIRSFTLRLSFWTPWFLAATLMLTLLPIETSYGSLNRSDRIMSLTSGGAALTVNGLDKSPI